MPKRAVWLMLAVAIVLSLVLVSPYLSLDVADSRLDVGGGPHYGVLIGHIFTAAVALVLGPLQFLAPVRARRRLHRAIGRVYLLAGVVPSAVTAIPVAVWSGRVLTQVGLSVAAVLWLVTAARAYRAARRRDFVAHREWMMRNYALTFLAVTARVVVPVILLVLVLVASGSVDRAAFGETVESLIPVGQNLGWLINLAIAERLIRRSRRAAQVPAY
ncbi:DUF2306 domain-containing protein [Actinoplanes aureus]|uniref:DUF2306 domain-containing protein n=1 Tax=Actinoplanes aureus TaxID=2792083 RepID=A0A931CEZ4_9ACTN|nr:DUF2306 domain-containing protein [Actinoplanes aureus]MBG0565973.1 DUF2306 domain-containing protein [Actinoplanes aureus]